jgi:hypothetical protein
VIVGGHRNTRVTRCVMSIGTVQGESSSPIRSPASRPCIPYACRIHPRPAVAVRAGDHGGAPRTDHTLWDRRRVSLPRSHLPRRPRPRPTPRAPSRTPTRRCQRATDRSSAATTAASARVCGRACGLSNAGTASDEGAAQRRVRAMPRSARPDRHPLQSTNPQFRASDRATDASVGWAARG